MSSATVPSADSKLASELLNSGLVRWGIELRPEQRIAYASYAEMLVDCNSRFNLTRLISPEQIALNHFLDSIALTQVVRMPRSASIIDIGTGPGFPGLPLKILRNDLKLVLIESTGKKLQFCREVATALDLKNIEFIHSRAEESATKSRYGKKADIVTARAVAPLKTLLQWTAPYMSSEGAIVAWKGSRVHEEMIEAKRTADLLGLKMDVVERTLTIKDALPVQHYYVVCRSR